MAERCEPFDIGDAQEGITRRLDPKKRGRARERRAHQFFVAKIDEFHVELTTTPPGVKEPVSAAVAIMRRDNAGADRQEVPDERNCCHAGRRDHSTCALLELSDCLREQIAGGVAGARVVVATLLPKTAKREC